MTEQEFALAPIGIKWSHLKRTMDYIATMDALCIDKQSSYDMRRRYNPQHSTEFVKLEEKALKNETRKLRIDQAQRWQHVKALYCAHRDELANTLDTEVYAECRSIMERIFTTEVDDALRNILEDNS
jgi:hypothetical protein